MYAGHQVAVFTRFEDPFIPDYELSYLVTETYFEDVDEYEPCNKTINQTNNETEEIEEVTYETRCYVDTVEVEKTRSYYETTSLSSLKDDYNNAEIGKEYYIKISGKLSRGESVDNILFLISHQM